MQCSIVSIRILLQPIKVLGKRLKADVSRPTRRTGFGRLMTWRLILRWGQVLWRMPIGKEKSEVRDCMHTIFGRSVNDR